MYAGGPPPTSVTWNGTAMTLSYNTSVGGGREHYFYTLASPATGTHAIAVTYTTTAYSTGSAISLSGTSGVGSTASSSGFTNTSSITVGTTTMSWDYANSPATNWVQAGIEITATSGSSLIIDQAITDGSESSGTASAGTSQTTFINGQTSNTNMHGASYKAAAPTTNIKTWDGLAKASVKTMNSLARASVKTINGLS